MKQYSVHSLVTSALFAAGLATVNAEITEEEAAERKRQKEREAKALMETIRCLTCQSQSIADSNASMAADMRSQIRERIMAGERPEVIRAWLVSRYGDWVSYEPTAAPILWPLWGAPLLLLALGVLLLRGRIGRRRS